MMDLVKYYKFSFMFYIATNPSNKSILPQFFKQEREVLFWFKCCLDGNVGVMFYTTEHSTPWQTGQNLWNFTWLRNILFLKFSLHICRCMKKILKKQGFSTLDAYQKHLEDFITLVMRALLSHSQDPCVLLLQLFW